MAHEVHSFWAEIKKYEDTLAKDPNSYCFAQLSELYRKIGLLDDAIYVANRGIEAHPDYVGGHLALGRAYFEKGQKAESRAVLELVVRMTPENHVAQKLLSKIYLEQGDVVLAGKSLEAVLALNPDDVECRLSLDALDRGDERNQSAGIVDDEDLLEEADIVEDDLLAFGEWQTETPVVPETGALWDNEASIPPTGSNGETLGAGATETVARVALPEESALADLFLPADSLDEVLIEEVFLIDAPVEVPRLGEDVISFEEAPIPAAVAIAAEPPPEACAVAPVKDPLTTATLAEIYRAQGFNDQALKIYRQLAEADPANAELRQRIAEIEATAEAATVSVSVPEPFPLPATVMPGGNVPQTAGVSALARANQTIAALEAWLADVDRRRACR